ncbi:hypothetical protein [Aeromonas hydrophila]|uniref:hypothetical protein n=1 Tax=Aeromonas hydrophila TaxID=644 RepID=UPI00191F6F7E|nr:hypothetical protein [Aeromonas hydrophila]MBL0560978.1 hypothetical protein [Aeromonas hydrophila]
MEKIHYDDLDTDKLTALISSRLSFEVTGLSGRMSSAVSKIENAIEPAGLTCRVYTRGRIAAAGASLLGGPAGVAGVISAAGIAVHNLATYNPDYEIAKHLVDNTLSVLYKK